MKTESWYQCLDFENVITMIKVFNSKIKELINYSSISIQKYKSKKKMLKL